jgi:hypothetical protein
MSDERGTRRRHEHIRMTARLSDKNTLILIVIKLMTMTK